MRYYVTIGRTTYEVDLTEGVPRVDGEEVEAELVAIPGTPVRHLLAAGRSLTVAARAGTDGWELHMAGERFEALVMDERTRAIRAMTGKAGAARGPKPVRAPMPGLVTRILAGEGDAVELGQGVVIVEAMKMENELKAEAAGVVSKVLVEAGQAVEKGAVLVEFRADETDDGTEL